MEKKSTVVFDEKVGVCVKDDDSVVAFQNTTCRLICGDMTGKACQKGCMRALSEMPPESLKNNSFVTFKNAFPDENVVDGILLKNNGFVTTLLFDVTRSVDTQMQLFEPYGLTHMEGVVVRLVLEGATNAEVAKKLCVARSTLRSHLNNIYRKIPENLRSSLLGRRGKESAKPSNSKIDTSIKAS